MKLRRYSSPWPSAGRQAFFVACLSGCSGASGTGTDNQVGGSASAGTTATGGTSLAGGNTQGGANATGGTALTGGTNTGGTLGVGGAVATGGVRNNTGGAAATGGIASTGGSPATGGLPTTTGGSRAVATTLSSTGGIAATGGSPSTGGTKTNTGGTSATGGTSSLNGGSNATGGLAGTGGARASGGTNTGGASKGGASGTAGSGTGGAGGGTSASTCNLVIGNSTTQQWFDGGFLTYPQIDATRWELFWVAHHYIDSWANPADSGWSTPFDSGHQCSRNATNPDRVIFIVTYAPPYPSEATYQTYITAIVNNIKSKYPGVRRIEITTLVRSPGNSETACSSKANNEQSIPAAEDQAIAAVAADSAFAGLVFALPPFYVKSCSDFQTDAPQYTTAGAADIAQVYGAYYAAHPVE